MASQDEEKKEIREPKDISTCAFVGWLIVGGVFILLLGSIPLLVASKFNIPNSAGVIGDSFGMINAFVSGLAFIGLIMTLLMQKQELRLQRQELKETREQFERSATAQEQSEKQLQRQVDLMTISSHLSVLTSLDATFEKKLASESVKDLERWYLNRIHEDIITRLEQIAAKMDANSLKFLETFEVSRHFAIRRLRTICGGMVNGLKSAINEDKSSNDPTVLNLWNVNRYQRAFGEMLVDIKWLVEQIAQIEEMEDVVRFGVRVGTLLSDLVEMIETIEPNFDGMGQRYNSVPNGVEIFNDKGKELEEMHNQLEEMEMEIDRQKVRTYFGKSSS